MIPDTVPSTSSLLASKVTVPQHVVYRSFPAETVVLNLQTASTTGSTPPPGACSRRSSRPPACATRRPRWPTDYEQDQSVVEQDLCELCQSLLERGLIETDMASAP